MTDDRDPICSFQRLVTQPSQLKSGVKFRTVSLRTVLIIPFVLQTLAAVSLVGYLSFRSGQNAVETLANQLMTEVGKRISDRLTAYLETPQTLVAANYLETQSQTLDVNNLEQLQQHLWQQIKLFPQVSTNYFWGSQQYAIGYGRILTKPFQNEVERITGEVLPLGTLFRMNVVKVSPQQQQLYYSVMDVDGQAKKLIYTFIDDYRHLQWYHHAQKTQQQSWTPIIGYRATSTLGMQASFPVYNQQGKFQGVFTSSIALEDISLFLRELRFSPTGQAFIIERSGDLVATSFPENPYLRESTGKLARLPVIQSHDPKTRAIAQHILQQFGDFKTLNTVQQLQLNFEQQLHFVQILPHQDDYGLDWLVVVIVPEMDFMEEIYNNIHNTILLCGAALVGAIAMGLFTASKITQRIRQISAASQKMAAGELEQELNQFSQVQELGALAQSFNQMADQLRQSFAQIQIALQISKDKFTTVFRASPDPIIIATLAEGLILEVNNRCLDFFQCTREEILNHTALELDFWYNSDQRQQFRNIFEKTGCIYGFEAEAQLKSGEIKTVLLSAEVCNLEHQDCIIVIVKDISDRKQAEKELQQSQIQLELFFSQSLDGFFFMILDQPIDWNEHIDKEKALDYIFTHQRITKVNEAMLQQYRAVQDDILGLTPQDFFAHNLPEGRKIWRNFFDQGRVHIETYEKRFDGSSMWVEGDYICLYDEQGRITGHFGVQRDISDRKQAEAALRDSEERFRSLFENSPVAYQALDAQGHYLDVNPELCNLLGYCEQELINRSFQEFWPVTAQRDFIKHFTDFQQANIIRKEITLQRKDNQTITVLLEGKNQRDAVGNLLKIHCILFNITERKRTEEALRQTKGKLSQVNRELAKLVHLDSLTQLANRRHFDSFLERQWQKLAKIHRPLTLILFDVDYFKRYNDYYGHQAGDQCLIKIAHTAQKIINHPQALVARYGGEEFVIVLPNISPKIAIDLAEKFRLSLETLAIPHLRSEVSTVVTISLGIATLIPSLEHSPETLIKQADQALYQAKSQGRNQYFYSTGDG